MLVGLALMAAGCLVQSKDWMGQSGSGDGDGSGVTGATGATGTTGTTGTSAGSEGDTLAESDSESGDGPDVVPLPPGCDDLPPLSSDAIVVGPEGNDGLAAIVAGAQPGATIALSPGLYPRQGKPPLTIQAAGVTLRSTTGNAEDVVLDGGGSDVPQLIGVAADDVLIADLTLQNVSTVLIRGVQDDVDLFRPTMYRLVLRDALGLKVAFAGAPQRDVWTHAGTIACSTLDMTDAFRNATQPCAPMGSIRVAGGDGWLVRDNEIRNHWCLGEGSVHAVILFENAARDTVVERNLLVDNHRGILFGNDPPTTPKGDQDSPCTTLDSGWGHIGGRIENNVIFIGDNVPASSPGAAPGDSMISVWWACDPVILHNTVVNTVEIFHSIESRFGRTVATIVNNVTTGDLVSRDGGIVLGIGENFSMVNASTVFVDVANVDLQLTAGAAPVDRGIILPGHVSPTDYLGNARVNAPDAGAYEWLE